MTNLTVQVLPPFSGQKSYYTQFVRSVDLNIGLSSFLFFFLSLNLWFSTRVLTYTGFRFFHSCVSPSGCFVTAVLPTDFSTFEQ